MFRIRQKDIVMLFVQEILDGCTCVCKGTTDPRKLCIYCWAEIYLDRHPDFEHIAYKGILVRRRAPLDK